MELKRYIAILKKWWWLIVVSMLVGAIPSYVAVSRAPRIYEASCGLVVGQSLSESNPRGQDLYLTEQLTKRYADMVTRRPVLQGVREALDLSFTPSVSAYAVPGTNYLEISVRDSNPERARAIADEAARQLILQSPSGSGQDLVRQAFIERQLANLETNIQETEAEIEDERGRLDAATSAREIQQYQANVRALEQKLASYQSTYATLLQAVEGGTNALTVFEPAVASPRPVSPKVGETVMLAAAIGAVLAIGGAFLIEYLDDTIKNPEEATQATNLPALGAIPRISSREHPRKLIALDDPQSPVTESYRALRTNIQFSSISKPARTIMITSPSPIEGKSVTTANLAVVMAQSGLSVIIVDADIRRPVMHSVFDLDNEHGLSDAILRTNPGISEHIQRTEIENLRVVTSGPLLPNPAELLGSEGFTQAIAELKRQADVVLFDSPPVLAVTDAALLSTHVDGVLLINDAGRTRRALAQQAVEDLHRVDANLLGVILNRLSTQDSRYRYYYYYYAADESNRRKKPPRP